jgi:carbon-monoxide dehydrogenase small subunit
MLTTMLAWRCLMRSRVVELVVNGKPTEVLAGPAESLQTVLRDRLRLTATKAGCRQGGCGSCCVLVDGEPVLACLLPAVDAAGSEVRTAEGLGGPDSLSDLQAAFCDGFAAQCGFCTPGMLMVTEALLEHDPAPDRATIAAAIAGNTCRCTGYQAIIDAVADAADRRAAHREVTP